MVSIRMEIANSWSLSDFYPEAVTRGSSIDPVGWLTEKSAAANRLSEVVTRNRFEDSSVAVRDRRSHRRAPYSQRAPVQPIQDG